VIRREDVGEGTGQSGLVAAGKVNQDNLVHS
jgi:hypothetical protein